MTLESPLRGQRVFVTGHTGFKGGWLSSWLLSDGNDVTGFALEPPHEPSFYARCGLADRMHSIISDVRDAGALKRALQESAPRVVFHLAAQSLVRRSYAVPVETFDTNVMGTVHVLEAVRETPSVEAVVVVTTDKCYKNLNTTEPYSETAELGGHDPYSASKACAELVTSAYRASFLDVREKPIGVATVRAGNVIGGGDWSEDRLIPDMVRALSEQRDIVIRNPASTRPWQHVVEVIAGYLKLATQLLDAPRRWSGAWNFGPPGDSHVPVREVADAFVRQWGSGRWTTPAALPAQPHEAALLAVDASKAQRELGWRVRLGLEDAIAWTAAWHKHELTGASPDALYKFTCEQIETYRRSKER
jgi:CDP-glucose 4,6-dehydratase